MLLSKQLDNKELKAELHQDFALLYTQTGGYSKALYH